MKTIIKKLITKYLRKNLKHYTGGRYLFHRWLVSLIVDKNREQELIAGLACSGDCANEISDLFLFDGKLYIVTTRPGLWIGKRGERIDKLQDKVGPIGLIENRKDNLMAYLHTRHTYMCEF